MGSTSQAERDAWKAKILEESTRLKANLAEARKRREESRKAADTAAVTPFSEKDVSEMEELEKAQKLLRTKSGRLDELKRQAEEWKREEGLTAGQMEKLKIAEEEMERTHARMEELEEEEGFEEEEEGEEEEFEYEEDSKPSPVPPVKLPRLERTESYMGRAEDTWAQMARESSFMEDKSARQPPPGAPSQPQKKDGFVVPSKPGRKEYKAFPDITIDMELLASPLIFFNLACFQGTAEGELEVMHPICGYATAGAMVAIMGPPGTDTTTLRVALGGMPEEVSDGVLVADFTVAGLLHVAEDILRKPTMDPNRSLLEIMGLEAVADERIGTAIQRGVKAHDAAAGTPRGARNPEMPTPRKMDARTFPGTRCAMHKAVLLMDDLSSILGAEDIFKVLRVLKKLALSERAAVLITLTRPFERRGLTQLFDYVLLFNEDGVLYFGKERALHPFMGLIGHPCPGNIHITDHILMVSNMAAKYDESPVKKKIEEIILRFTGIKEEEDQTPRGTPIKSPGGKSGAFVPKFMRRRRKKAKKNQLPEALETATPENESHAKRLARRLAEERREQAKKQATSEKEEVWEKLASLDGFDVNAHSHATFEHMLVGLQQTVQSQMPSCFMNLACFIDVSDDVGDFNALQETCAYATEGRVLGVVGPSAVDADNLLNSLKVGSSVTTIVTDLSVRDAIKLAEAVESDGGAGGMDANVDLLMAKMTLTACAQEVIGTLIQRTKANQPPQHNVQIGNQVLSTATRSILVLDRILALDAQSLYVVLKLIHRIAMAARLAVVVMLEKPEEQKGLLCLMDNALIFSGEGMFYFGPTEHLVAYCELVDYRVPAGIHVVDHIQGVMKQFTPYTYRASPTNLATPFTLRYGMSALKKYHQRVIDISTKPPDQGGSTARTMLPKVRGRKRKDEKKQDQARFVQEKAEQARIRIHGRKLQLIREERAQAAMRVQYATDWQAMAEKRDGVVLDKSRAPEQPGFGVAVIAEEMRSLNRRPSLFFNLASFLPDVMTERADLLQPICGFAVVGRLVGFMGPEFTEMGTFITTLTGSADTVTTPRGLTSANPLSIADILKINDKEAAPAVLAEVRDVVVGTFIERRREPGAATVLQSIAVLEDLTGLLNPDEGIELLLYLKKISYDAGLTVVVNCPREVAQVCVMDLLDDTLIFDENGMSYFGPISRLRHYLGAIGLPVPADMHSTQHLSALMTDYQIKGGRTMTDTSPAVRYQYSLIREYVRAIAAEYTGTPDEEELRRLPGINQGQKYQLTPQEEALVQQQLLADMEAEAERQRIAESEAENMWKMLAADADGAPPA